MGNGVTTCVRYLAMGRRGGVISCCFVIEAEAEVSSQVVKLLHPDIRRPSPV